METAELMKGVIMLGGMMVVGVAGFVMFKWKRWQSWDDSRRYDVVPKSFAVDDGIKVNMQVSRHWENGYISEYYPEYDGNMLFIDFDTEGGSEMVQREITVDLPPECDSIYFNRSGGRYMLVLRKDDSGQWSDTSKLYIFKERESNDENDEYDEEN